MLMLVGALNSLAPDPEVPNSESKTPLVFVL